MGYTLVPLPLFTPKSFPSSTPRHTNLRLAATAAATALPSPRPRTKRHNHLRRKLTRPQTPNSQPPILPPSISLPSPQILFLEESLIVEQSEAVDPFPAAAHRWFPWPVIDLALRFAALIAVQTVATVWLLSRGAEDRSNGGGIAEVVEEERVGSEQRLEGLEFERKVSVIRAMVAAARLSERDEDADKESGGESNSRGRIRVQVGDSKKSNAPNAPEGFNRLKSKDERSSVGNGGIQQIVHQSPLENSFKVHEHSQPSQLLSMTPRKLPDVKTSSNVASTKKSTEKIGNDTSLSGTGFGNSFLENSQRSSSFRKSRPHLQSEISRSTSPMQNESEQLEIHREKTFREENRKSSTKSRNIKRSSTSPMQNESEQLEIHREKTFRKENRKSSTKSRNIKHSFESGSKSSVTEHKPTPEKEKDGPFIRKELWWLKLPYVLAIFLHTGSDRSAPKGLYSIKMNSPEKDGIYPSYTITFQDRGDATNFCYILESFFEYLGEISADIVPLTIQELDDAVKTETSKVIVVRKGQLRLYAGQPLTEVEAELRSFVD